MIEFISKQIGYDFPEEEDNSQETITDEQEVFGFI